MGWIFLDFLGNFEVFICNVLGNMFQEYFIICQSNLEEYICEISGNLMEIFKILFGWFCCFILGKLNWNSGFWVDFALIYVGICFKYFRNSYGVFREGFILIFRLFQKVLVKYLGSIWDTGNILGWSISFVLGMGLYSCEFWKIILGIFGSLIGIFL